MPSRRIYWWNKEIHHFNRAESAFVRQPWANGVILLGCVAIAMLLANLPFTSYYYHSFLETQLSLHFQSPHDTINWSIPRGMTVETFINDILMVIFFFSVGLEIKREVGGGELSTFKKAIMPIIAAFGGVCVPALIFTTVNHGTFSASGWGIPTATDIAFAIGILSILGDRVPVSLKVFLTALAIADDLIAILVVALFYGGTINGKLLLIALVIVMLVIGLKRLGEKRMFFYIVPLIILWFLFYYAGIHATMSGVVMAFLIPMEARYNKAKFYRRHRILMHGLEDDGAPDSEFPDEKQRYLLRRLSGLSKRSIPPAYRIEQELSPWVNYLIMPVFALANAGVVISDASYFNIFHFDPQLGSVSMGVFLGLLIGKPLGISLASFLAIKCHVGEMPAKASWPMLIAVACLGGIGFTMSLFVDTLSFGGPDIPTDVTQHLRNAGKIAVLLGSLCSGILGSVLINIVSKAERRRAAA